LIEPHYKDLLTRQKSVLYPAELIRELTPVLVLLDRLTSRLRTTHASAPADLSLTNTKDLRVDVASVRDEVNELLKLAKRCDALMGRLAEGVVLHVGRLSTHVSDIEKLVERRKPEPRYRLRIEGDLLLTCLKREQTWVARTMAELQRVVRDDEQSLRQTFE